MAKPTKINWNEKIPEISKKIEEIKITSFYMLSTDLYKIDNNKLIKIITQKFENHPATIAILIGTKDNELYEKKHELWKLPDELLHLENKVIEKTNYYLDLYFSKLEKNKQNYLQNSESNQFIKFIFTPLIEVDENEELYFFFITLTIFQNGSIVIELFEDLRSSFYLPDFFHPYTKMKTKIFPDFNQKSTTYSTNPNQQIDDMLRYIKKELSSINGGIHLSERFFFLHFIMNMDEMNKLEFFKTDKLHTWMINAPYSLKSLSSSTRSKYYTTNFYDFDTIRYINKGANYIIWNTESTSKFESNFLSQASFFLASATPLFQLITLDETIMDGIEKFQLSNNKQLIKFNEWTHNFKRSFLYIYRLNHFAITDLFNHLQTTSYFKHNEYMEKIKQEEFNLLKERNQYNDFFRNRIMEVILFMIGSVSILQIVDIFTDSLKIIWISLTVLIVILILVFIVLFRKRK
ncbi:hypothetical protein [Streptococcus caballi]|nr:hypothetical protein [Streptococcus caballi]